MGSASLLLVSLGATPAAARKAPAPQKQVRVAVRLLIKVTQAFYDGDADRAPSQSNTIQFSVGD